MHSLCVYWRTFSFCRHLNHWLSFITSQLRSETADGIVFQNAHIMMMMQIKEHEVDYIYIMNKQYIVFSTTTYISSTMTLILNTLFLFFDCKYICVIWLHIFLFRCAITYLLTLYVLWSLCCTCTVRYTSNMIYNSLVGLFVGKKLTKRKILCIARTEVSINVRSTSNAMKNSNYHKGICTIAKWWIITLSVIHINWLQFTIPSLFQHQWTNISLL